MFCRADNRAVQSLAIPLPTNLRLATADFCQIRSISSCRFVLAVALARVFLQRSLLIGQNLLRIPIVRSIGKRKRTWRTGFAHDDGRSIAFAQKQRQLGCVLNNSALRQNKQCLPPLLECALVVDAFDHRDVALHAHCKSSSRRTARPSSDSAICLQTRATQSM